MLNNYADEDPEFAKLLALADKPGDDFDFGDLNEDDLEAEIARASKVDLSGLDYSTGATEESFEFDENDMNDPELLNGLAELGWEEPAGQRAPDPPQHEQRLAALKQQLDESKKKAVSLKRSGNKPAAIEEMKNMKRLKQEVADLEKDAKSWKTNAAKVGQRLDDVESLQRQNAEALGIADTSVASESLINDRISQYKRAAVTCKRAGRTKEAKVYLRTMKEARECLEMTQNGIDVTMGELPPELAPNENAEKAKSAPKRRIEKEQQAASSAPGQNSLQIINERLNEYKTLAIGEKRAGNIAEAKKLMVHVKKLKTFAQQAQQGVRVDTSQLPPPLSAGKPEKHEKSPKRPQTSADVEAASLEQEIMAGFAAAAASGGGKLASQEEIKTRLDDYESASRGDGRYADEIQMLKECLEMVTEGMDVELEDLPPSIRKDKHSKSKHKKSKHKAEPKPEPEAPDIDDSAPPGQIASKELIEDRLRQYKEASGDHKDDVDHLSECLEMIQMGVDVEVGDLPPALKTKDKHPKSKHKKSKQKPEPKPDSEEAPASDDLELPGPGENASKELIEERLQQYKDAGGDHKDEVDLLNECLEMVQMGVDVEVGDLPPPLKTKKKSKKAPKPSGDSKYASMKDIEKLIESFTQRARRYKSEDRIEDAKECLKQVIALEKLEAKIKSGHKVKMDELPAKHKSSKRGEQKEDSISPSQSSKGHKKKSKSGSAPGAEWVDVAEEKTEAVDGAEIEEKTPKRKKKKAKLTSKQKLEYASLIKKLETQIEDLDAEAKRLLVAKDKPAALEMYRARKESSSDLELLEISRDKRYPPPSYSTVPRTIIKELSFPHLQSNDLEITVEKCIDIQPPKGYHDIDGYIEVMIDLAGNKYNTTTSVVRGLSPEFNFAKCFKFERNRASRKFKFCKVELTMYHSRPIIRDVFIGQGTCRLKNLIDHSEYKCSVQMRDKHRKTVGSIETIFRISKPLEGKDVRKVRCEHIALDQFYGDADSPRRPPAPAPSKQRSSVSSKPRPSPSNPKPKPSGTAGKTAPQTASKPVVAAGPLPAGITEEMVQQPYSPDLMVSNDVMEAEVQRLTQVINSYANKGKRAPKEVVNSMGIVQYNLQMLVMQVQNGELELEAYLEKLKHSAKRDKQLAVALKRRGNMKDAGACLRRSKIMEKELAGAQG